MRDSSLTPDQQDLARAALEHEKRVRFPNEIPPRVQRASRLLSAILAAATIVATLVGQGPRGDALSVLVAMLIVWFAEYMGYWFMGLSVSRRHDITSFPRILLVLAWIGFLATCVDVLFF